jgi:putative transposase
MAKKQSTKVASQSNNTEADLALPAKKKSRRSKTPSFILELPLRTTRRDRNILESRFEAGRHLYNACLDEALKRLKLVKESKLYQQARKAPKAERFTLFQAARAAWSFNSDSLEAFASHTARACWIGELDTHVIQKLGQRAFKAVERVMFNKAKKVRFKGKNQQPSLENKENTSGIRYRDGSIHWMGLKLKAIIDYNNPVVKYGLSQKIKFNRLLQRERNGKVYIAVQLILEGKPLPVHQRKILRPGQKPPVPLCSIPGTVGLDLGPRIIAVSSEQSALLQPICAELATQQPEIRRLQRKLERLRRINNPGRYKANSTVLHGPQKQPKIKFGTIKPKGEKDDPLPKWNNSKRYLRIQAKLRDLKRKQAAHRKSLHGKLSNEVLRLGNTFHLEDISYKSWQKQYGKSVGHHAPGMFVESLKRKAESASGNVIELSTQKTYLSSRCQCGRRARKALSERVHRCPQCGTTMQRDLYSAYLARYIQKDLSLSSTEAVESWEGAEQLLTAAWQKSMSTKKPRVVVSARTDVLAQWPVIENSINRVVRVENGVAKAEGQNGVEGSDTDESLAKAKVYSPRNHGPSDP